MSDDDSTDSALFDWDNGFRSYAPYISGSHFLEPPASVSAAKFRLASIFLEYHRCGDDWSRIVVDIMTRFPLCAADTFRRKVHGQQRRDEADNNVTVCMLARRHPGLELSHLQKVCELDPGMLRHVDSDQKYALHHACENDGIRLPTEIIAYLVNKYPSALEVKDKNGFLPIHLLVRNKTACLSAVRVLVEAYPASLHVRGGWQGYQETPLQVLLNNMRPGSPEIVQYLLQRMPWSHDMTELDVLWRDVQPHEQLTEQLAALFAEKILPKLTSFQSYMSSWTRVAKLVIYRALAVPTLLQHLHLCISGDLPHQCDAVEQILRANQQLTSFRLKSGQTTNRALFHAVRKGLVGHSSLQALDLNNFQRVHLVDVAGILTCGAPLRVLALTAAVFDSSDDFDWSACADDMARSPLRSMLLLHSDVRQNSLANLLELLACCPDLKEMFHRDGNYAKSCKANKQAVRQATKALVDILEHQGLEELALNPSAAQYCLDMTSVLTALQGNQTLHSLSLAGGEHAWQTVRTAFLRDNSFGHLVEALRHHNATLLQVRPSNKEVKYLTLLNKNGRGEARDPKTTMARLVEIFNMAATGYHGGDDDDDHYFDNELVQQCLLFDLLRESPSIWCDRIVCYGTGRTNNLAGRKRKQPSP